MLSEWVERWYGGGLHFVAFAGGGGTYGIVRSPIEIKSVVKIFEIEETRSEREREELAMPLAMRVQQYRRGRDCERKETSIQVSGTAKRASNSERGKRSSRGREVI